MSDWHLYILRTRLDTLYTGITKDVERRLREHAQGMGAKSLRSKAPLNLEYQLCLADRAIASRLENHVKQLSRAAKERLICTQPAYAELLQMLGLEEEAV